jgi:glycosyltransferase involved in cell wall biosynthesis
MSQSVPTVSVIVPCYNQGQYLDEAVGSILAQTYQSFEVIVIDDGSTDAETVKLLQNYQKPTVKVIHTDNRGPSAARNTGIQQAIGHYILPLDADDRIQPTYLEKAVNLLDRQPEVGIVYSQAEFFGTKTGLCNLPAYSFPGILVGNMIFNSSFYRKADWQKVGGYRENMIHGWEDYDFWLSIVELGREVVQIPEPLYLYRQVPNSRSERLTRDRQITSYAQLFHNHPRLYSEHIDTLFQHLVELREDIHQTHSLLEKTRIEQAQTQTELVQTQGKLTHYQNLLTAIQSSKFWKLRNQWVRFRKLLGLNPNHVVDDYL